MTINGDAAQVGNRLRLAPSEYFAGGSVFTNTPISLGFDNSFSTYFQFQISRSDGIGDGDGTGADGIVFVVQTVSDSVGGLGGGIGYEGIANSVGIEFDTYDNGSWLGDSDGNHVAIDLDGVLTPLDYQAESRRFNDGDIWNVWVDYDGVADLLEVRWDLTLNRPIAPILSLSIDLVDHLGTDSAYVGFTSATGSGTGDHDILTWEFRDEFNPIRTVPEPSTLLGAVAALLGFALASVGRTRRSGR